VFHPTALSALACILRPGGPLHKPPIEQPCRSHALESILTINRIAPAPTAEPIADSASPLDIIFVEGFVGETVIGIHESELHRTQPLVIDVHAGLPRARACSTDRIADTIDYGGVCERLRRLLVEHRLQLLEALAETIAEILIGEFGASWVRVKVVKPKKFADVSAVGVQIERTATPPDRSVRAAAVLQLIGSGMVPGGR
jgi:7,8-dihydroneopterin aldolase/epimerase/oxygenase